jgi:WD40 repeat protein
MRVIQDDTPGQVTALAYSPEGPYLAVGSSDGLVRLWCPHSGRLVRTFEYVTLACVTSLSFRPRAATLAAGYSQGTVHVWETATGVLSSSLHAGPTDHPPSTATVVQYRPDGQRLVAGQMGIVTEWPTGSNKPARVLRPLSSYMVKPVCSLAFGPENILAVGEVNHVQVWPAVGNQVRAELNWPEGDIVGLHFLPGQAEANGARVLVARGRSVGLFEMHIGQHWKRLKELRHAERLHAAVLTGDGSRLLAAGDDWTVHVWDTSSWQKAAEHNWRLGPVRLLAVAPDGMTAAVVGAHRPGVLIWDLE